MGGRKRSGRSHSGESGRLGRHPVGRHCRLEEVTPPPLAQLIALGLMHATQVATPFHRPGWVYEEKVDGYRMVAYKDGEQVRLISRQGKEFTQRFPELAKAVAAIGAESVILDAELSVFDQQFVPFIVAWGAIPGATSGAHLHVGQPSPRFTARGCCP